MTKRLIALCFPLLLLSGCTQFFEIDVSSSGGSTRLSFFEKGFLSKKPISPCLRNIEIFARGNPDKRIAFIRPLASSCIPTHEVDLAALPAGYELIAAQRGPMKGRFLATALPDKGRRGMSEEFTVLHLPPVAVQ